jgi:hypothetical protein
MKKYLLILLLLNTAHAVDVVRIPVFDSLYKYVDTLDVLFDKLDSTDAIGMEQLYDVDTSSIDKYDVPLWNGTKFIMAPADTTLEFDITSFTENISNTVLIGADASNWLAIGGVSFSAAYDNGPPSVATVNLTSLPAGISAWGSDLDMGSPNFTGPTASEAVVTYPTNTATSVRFLLSTTPADTRYTGYFYFYNYIFYGADVDSTPNEAAIEAMSSSLTDDHTQTSLSITGVGATEHIIFACRAGKSNLDSTHIGYGTLTSDDGSYRLSLDVTLVDQTLSITNSNSKVENYDVYSSNLEQPGGSASATLRTNNAYRNYIKWGVVSDTNSMDETDIHALVADSVISDDETRTFTVTAGAGEYIAYAWPTRLGTVTFWVGGFEGGFQDPKTIAVTNQNGCTENYYLAQSSTSGLGTTEGSAWRPMLK